MPVVLGACRLKVAASGLQGEAFWGQTDLFDKKKGVFSFGWASWHHLGIALSWQGAVQRAACGWVWPAVAAASDCAIQPRHVELLSITCLWPQRSFPIPWFWLQTGTGTAAVLAEGAGGGQAPQNSSGQESQGY